MATMFPQTLGPQYVDPHAAQIEAMRARMQQPAPPMYTPEEQQQRIAQNEREFQLGLLGLMSGNEQLGSVGGQVLKQALAQRQPRVTERGVADPLTGKFTYGQDYLRERDEATLAGLETKSASARAAYETERRQAADKRELQDQRMQDMKELRQISAANGQVGAFQQAGFTPDGKSVVTNTKSGVNYVLQMNPDGTPNYIPYGGVYTPKATFEKNVTEASEAMRSADRADSLLGAVEANPDMFGLRSAAVSTVPGPMQGYAAMALQLKPEQLEMRARVLREAALEINALYGAALSAGESARAASFLPNAQDPPEMIIAKLKAARDWARSSAAMQGPAAQRAAKERMGGAGGSWGAPAASPAAPGGEGWSITPKGATAPPARRGM